MHEITVKEGCLLPKPIPRDLQRPSGSNQRRCRLQDFSRYESKIFAGSRDAGWGGPSSLKAHFHMHKNRNVSDALIWLQACTALGVFRSRQAFPLRRPLAVHRESQGDRKTGDCATRCTVELVPTTRQADGLVQPRVGFFLRSDDEN